MDALSVLSTWSTWLFVGLIFVACFIIRRVVEGIFPSLSKKTEFTRAQDVWEKVVLPILPASLGILFAALVSGYPYPEVITTLPENHVFSARVAFGASFGFLSAWGYRVLKFILERMGVQAGDTPPNAGGAS